MIAGEGLCNRQSTASQYFSAMDASRSEQRFSDDVGRLVNDVRRSLRWSQRELGRRSGLPQSRISTIERGLARRLRLAEIDAVFVTLGVSYRLAATRPLVDPAPLADLVHVRCSAYAHRRLTTQGWLVEREVPVGGNQPLGWIDLLAFDPRSSTLLIIEVKTEIRDLGEIERSLSRYEREARGAVAALGWRATRVVTVLLLLASAVNDDRVHDLRPVLHTVFPGRARSLQLALHHPEAATLTRYLAMIDPRSRRSAWLRATASDGRRTPAPYIDYIDAVRKLEAGRAGQRRHPSRSRDRITSR